MYFLALTVERFNPEPKLQYCFVSRYRQQSEETLQGPIFDAKYWLWIKPED